MLPIADPTMAETQTYGDRRRTPHIVLVPSAGMGHLTPFLRLAAQLSARDCRVSLLTTHPTVSAAEERHVDAFFAAFPGVRRLDLHLPLLDPSELNCADPFFLRFESIRRSAHLLPRVLADASPPVSAVIVDIVAASSYLPAVAEMGLPSYVLFTSSAAMLALCAYFPTYLATKNTFGVGDIDIPGAGRVPKSSVPMLLHDPNQLFAKQFLENGQALPKADGILVNTLHALEPEVLAALNEGKVTPDLPPVLAIGPILPEMSGEGESFSAPLAWLDRQPDRSVVYVSFGSRTAMPAEQIRELGIGLERSGLRFLWVVKSKMVDRAELEVGLEELLGEEYLAKIKDRGMVVKDWVEQAEILRHRAVGGFVSHCGWNSVTEAALYGVRILAWPIAGDQRVNAAVVARGGLGIWVEGWSWQAEEPIKAEEISERLKDLMAVEGLRAMGAEAADVGGTSYQVLTRFVESLKL
ncbi:UDP-glycosyltransferase CGT-like [Zingiber officinale]|nr:UDP-glycosyltransferase CGT-like [Zingiber officinale]